MQVWDEHAASCQAFAGATCGGLGQREAGYGEFHAGAPGQYLLVTQRYEVEGGSCTVEDEARYAIEPFRTPAEPEWTVKATYRCSGAAALGWPLLGAGFAGAVAVAWVLKRKLA